jgi:putative ABC transport system permease protein
VTVAFFCWRAAVRRSWRQAMVLALMGGLLGAVALGALAGARRTAAAYGRYLASIHASDVFVNVPGKLPGMPVMRPITLISSLPGVVSHAAYVGLNGLPVVHGRIDHSFLTNSLNGSLDGEYLSQDRMTVLAGRLPRLGSTTEIVLTPLIAWLFGTGVGGTVEYVYQPLGADGQPTGRQFTRSYRVAAIGEVPPALVDQSDAVQGAILPPGATRQVLAEYFYAWIGLRLARGIGGIPALQADLARLARQVQRQETRSTHQNLPSLSFTVSRSDVIRNQVQQAIRPEAIALSVFGAIAALAMVVLAGQGLSQMISRSAPDIAVIRALGATRAQAALAAGLTGVIPVLGGAILAVAGAVAISPLAPVGPVRRYDPSRGIWADGLVHGAGGFLIGVVLLGLLVVLAIRSVRQSKGEVAARPSAFARTAAAAGMPASAVVGTRNALEPGSGARSVPVRSTLLGSIAAVTAVVSAVVFNASLAGLISHPARYGWNWDVVIQTQSGYGSFTPGAVNRLIHGQPAVAGWSEFAFGQLPVNGRIVPVLGIRRHLGAVQPPTTSGRPLSGKGQIELGTVTLGQLGKKIGDTVRIGNPPFARTVTITGTVTLPSFGVGGADHVSLGRGAMLPEATLLAAVGAGSRPRGPAQSVQVYPSAVAIDLAPGTTKVQRAQLIHRIVSANPDGTPGGSYELRHALAAAVVNAGHLGGQPLALALGLAAAAVLSLALTVLSLVRRRRRELALLKALGMTRGQVRVVVVWQTTLTLLIAVAIGGPLGIAGGRLAWQGFARSLGAVPVVEVPVLALIVGLAALVVAGNLLATVPAAAAARTRAAAGLRAE